MRSKHSLHSQSQNPVWKISGKIMRILFRWKHRYAAVMSRNDHACRCIIFDVVPHAASSLQNTIFKSIPPFLHGGRHQNLLYNPALKYSCTNGINTFSNSFDKFAKFRYPSNCIISCCTRQPQKMAKTTVLIQNSFHPQKVFWFLLHSYNFAKIPE